MMKNSAKDVIQARFEAHMQPLGTGQARNHTKKVSRWTHKGRETIVTEKAYPNVWLRKQLFDRFDATPPVGHEVFHPAPDGNPGFHSNVHSTPGLKGETLVKFRAADAAKAAELADFLFHQIEKHT
jgi:hypothetical protein